MSNDGGLEILVSKRDEYLLSQKWIMGQNGYAYLSGARKKNMPCLMHRIILDAQKGQEVHHMNGNKLDNRRENLKLTTPSEHQTYHRDELIERNKKRRVYDEYGDCAWCGEKYKKNPEHRGRQQCCSKKCGIQYGLSNRRKNKGY